MTDAHPTTTTTTDDETADGAAPATGTLYGVGLGPGDPRLLTLAAVDAIRAADVVAYHRAPHGGSVARSIAEPHLREDHVEEVLVYPVTTGTTDHPGGYRGAIDEFYDEAAARLAAHLDAGRDVAVLAEGDPFMYSSYQHMHERLADRYPTVVVPGISSVTACSSALSRPLVEAEESLTIIPGTLPEDELVERLERADSAVVMKLGRTYPKVRRALQRVGRLDDAWYTERVSQGDREVVAPLASIDEGKVPYFSLAVLPSRVGSAPWMPSAAVAAQAPAAEASGRGVTFPVAAVSRAADRAVQADAEPVAGPSTGDAQAPGETPGLGYVEVVGLGPAGEEWRTPEAGQAIAQATDIVGYTTYVRRVPDRPGLVKHDSDNKVESERAEFALDLALRGRRVVVVSSGDPGVFAMATAVLEVAAEPRYAGVPVRVMPGMTAAHAAASRVGAPLGHDYATISLSDRLKPFDVVRDRVRAAAAADLVIAMYNPASKERTWQVQQIKEDLLAIRDAATPVVLARAIGDPAGERVHLTTLSGLDPAMVDMRTLILVGSSQTRVDRRTAPADAGRSAGAPVPDASGEPVPGLQDVVWTPRRYPEAGSGSAAGADGTDSPAGTTR